MRGPLRYLLTSLLVGMLSVGLAWAGSGLMPVVDKTDIQLPTVSAEKASTELTEELDDQVVLNPADLPAGTVLAGAAKINLYPRQDDYKAEFPGATWNKNFEECQTFSLDGFPAGNPLDHAATAGSPWPENQDCIYMGGYDIGPVNPIVEFDEEYGIWVRSFVVTDAQGDSLVLTIVDGEGYFWDYEKKCTAISQPCGSKEISQELGQELGISPDSFVIAATHSHTAPEFIGGWGFVPDWYMNQVGDSIRDSIRQAWNNREVAVLEMGEELARQFNSERRGTYRSAEEQELTWLRAVGQSDDGQPKTIATVGAYAAHPTTADEDSHIGHADWPVTFETALEERFGGIGLHFMTGLGNMTARGGTMMGRDLAQLVPGVGQGIPIQNTDLRVTRTTWNQPTTNAPLSALGVPGFFDRKFVPVPAHVEVSKPNGDDPDWAPCVSGSPVSVELPATAARIGDEFALTAAPGEIFANLSNTIKDQSGARVTMPLGQANDALGYMPQSFELSPIGQQGLGFVAGGVLIVNYEDSYAIDKCVGDMVLETTLGLLEQIKPMV